MSDGAWRRVGSVLCFMFYYRFCEACAIYATGKSSFETDDQTKRKRYDRYDNTTIHHYDHTTQHLYFASFLHRLFVFVAKKMDNHDNNIEKLLVESELKELIPTFKGKLNHYIFQILWNLNSRMQIMMTKVSLLLLIEQSTVRKLGNFSWMILYVQGAQCNILVYLYW